MRKIMILLIALMVISVGFLGGCTHDDKSSDINEGNLTNGKNDAYLKSQEYMIDELVAPATADFPTIDKVTFVKKNENTWGIVSYVDAQNSFGALIRTYYSCKLVENEDTWALLYFKTGDSFEEVYTVEVKPEEEIVFFHPDYDDEEYYSCWLEAGIITLRWIQDTGDNIKGQQWDALKVNCDTISDMLDNKYLDCSVSPSWLEIKAIHAVITLEIITVASDGRMAGMFLSSYEELKAEGIYDDATILKIKDRVNILRKLLPGQKVTDLQMIDTLNGKQVLNMGFDTTKTSAGATFLYNKHAGKLSTMYKTLYEINAKYTILVFWAADCGHCQKEVPKLYKDLQSIKGSVDFKVYAVQTKEELFNDWKKFISENNLKDFIHVFDPVHINNIKETFDITGTPVIFLLDKDKKVKAKKLAADQVVDIIKNLETAEKNLIK